MNRLADIALGVWFLLVAVTFWGPYLGMPLSPNLAGAVYAGYLLIAVLALALRIVRKQEHPTVAVERDDNRG